MELEKWNLPIKLEGLDINNLYYFWQKGRDWIIAKDITIWESQRQKNIFYNLFNISHQIFEIYMNNGKYNGQTKSEYQKNYKRVADIVEKSAGDVDKATYLSKQQTAKITDEWKAINRAIAARDMGHDHIFEVFFQRAYELGTVSKQDYRDYKLSKLGI